MSNTETEYTNFLPLFNDLKLDHRKDMLWLMHHGTRTTLPELKNKNVWKNRENIFLIDSENILLNKEHEWIDDARINIWTPCVSTCKRANLYHFWFNWMQEIEKSLNYIDKLKQCSSKKYFFDALLGTKRNHKDIIYSLLKDNPNKDKFLFNYSGNLLSNPNAHWILANEDEIPGQMITYNKVQKANASCVIHYLIYNQCWYSLVAETTGSQPNFFTEKTGKPLLSKRLFVIFAGYHHLSHLREFGFKTFNGIIDESYDNIKDQKTRYKQAWKQVEFLMKQDPIEIYKQAQSILEHNYKHFMETNWQNEMHQKIQNISHLSK